MIRIFCLILTLLVYTSSIAQTDDASDSFLKSSSWNFSLGFGVDVPLADLADRFGSNLAVKGQIERQTGAGWVYGLQYDFMFGNTVKQDVLENIRIDNGNVLGTNSTYATALQRMRGGFIGLFAGKILPLSSKYKSGLKISLAAGLFQHQIRLVDDERNFPIFNEPYSQGYDLLSRGLGLKEFVGWQYLAANKRVNFYIGLEFTQGFTSSVRKYDFSSGALTNQDSRFDGVVGLRVGLILPFYSAYEDEEIFY